MSWTPNTNVAQAVWDAGFCYCPRQDIIYSRLSPSPFQYALGYCWAYDETSAPLSMILDCERFYFSFGQYQWLIELWKGQYGLETGCEIGVYALPSLAYGYSVQPQLAWYPAGCTLQMSSRLYTPNGLLLHRGPTPHWWLTGFKWGVFTQRTQDLSLEITIQFPNSGMCNAFLSAAQAIGYSPFVSGLHTVALTFRNPRTPQPGSRHALETQMQEINGQLVQGYNYLKNKNKLQSNDPNNFVLPAPAPAQIPLVSYKPPDLSPLRGFGEVLERPRGSAPDVAAAISHEVFCMFEKKVWHTTRTSGAGRLLAEAAAAIRKLEHEGATAIGKLESAGRSVAGKLESGGRAVAGTVKSDVSTIKKWI